VPQCKACGDEADELVSVKVDGKTKRLCESCAEQVNEQDAIKQDSESVVQNMMGFKGRR
jgi:ribosome-binding protein aMBF1 (putative translation factor)